MSIKAITNLSFSQNMTFQSYEKVYDGHTGHLVKGHDQHLAIESVTVIQVDRGIGKFTPGLQPHPLGRQRGRLDRLWSTSSKQIILLSSLIIIEIISTFVDVL